MNDFEAQYESRTPKSKKMYQQARELMPGGVSHGVRYFPPYPLFLDRVEGSRIWDVDGNEYIDTAMGMGVHFTAIHATDAETVRHLVSRIFRYDVLQRSQETLKKDE